MKENSVRQRVYDLINLVNSADRVSRAVNAVLITATITNVVLLIAGTFDIPPAAHEVMDVIELITLVIFIIEYALRVWTAPELFPGESYPRAILHFALSFFGLIDLLSIIPYFLPAYLPSGLVALRILRIFRIFKLFRINARYDAFNVVLDVLKQKRSQILSSVVLIFTFMLASSLLMYSLEHPAQPENFQNAFSGMWWSVSAIFTVGYGDIYPITALGQVLAIVISFLGVGLVAIPTGIISAGFVEQYSKMKSLSEASNELPINFIEFTIENTHPWAGQAVKSLSLPPDLLIVAIVRNDKVMIPRGDTILDPGDVLVVSAIEFRGDIGIKIREVTITKDHEWINKKIKDMRFPDDMLIVSIIRHGKPLLPRGATVFHEDDKVMVCRKALSLSTRTVNE